MIITADHGNAEEKRYRASSEPRTKHTTNPVPCFLVGGNYRLAKPRSDEEIKKQFHTPGGVLTDIAPTVIELMGLEKPGEMIGISLLGVLANNVNTNK